MLEDLFKQLRDTPRLRWGIAVIIGIAWLYAILLMNDNLQQQIQQHRAATHALTRLNAQLAQPEWEARMASSKILVAQLEGSLWQAPTAGLAQAALQDELTTTLNKLGATHTLISVTVIDEIVADATEQNSATATTTTPHDLWKIKAKLGFDYDAPRLLAFLQQLETQDKRLVIETLNVRQAPAAHIEMEIAAYFQKQAVKASEQQRTP